MLVEITDLYLWMLCLARCGALFFWIPIFSGKMIPMQFRFALAAMVSMFAAASLEVSLAELPLTLIDLIIYMLKEFIVGAFMGVAVHIVFFAVDFAGRIISQETGLAMSSSFDPNSGSTNTTYGTLFFYFAVLLMLATEMHHEVLYAYLRSYEVVPIGMVFPGAGGMQNLLEDTSWIFALGLQMAAPMIAIAFVVNLTFAVLGKAAPKINVFITSFAVRILVGMLFVSLTLGLVMQYILYAMGRAPERMLQYLIP